MHLNYTALLAGLEEIGILHCPEVAVFCLIYQCNIKPFRFLSNLADFASSNFQLIFYNLDFFKSLKSFNSLYKEVLKLD